MGQRRKKSVRNVGRVILSDLREKTVNRLVQKKPVFEFGCDWR